MQYRERAAELLHRVIEELRTLDELTEAHPSHKLDTFESLRARLESIRQDLLQETRLGPAIRKTTDLNLRLLGGLSELDDPRYRSRLAEILGRYQRSGKPPKSKLI